MRSQLALTASAVAIVMSSGAAYAQESDPAETDKVENISSAPQPTVPTIIVTATRREERLQDVPLSVTAFQQEELTEKGIVGYESLALETPGVVINRPTQNFNNFTARGISTNGYGAGLQGAVAIYIDELPISANGNSTILDPTLFDVERVEFLRGPQGTLFGSSSLAGAMRILTKSPNLSEFEASGLIDFGLTDGDTLRQRYNGMVNIPIVFDELGFRAVGFYRHEDGWVDNIGTGVEDSNVLESFGGRAMLMWQPTNRLSMRAMALYEDSDPQDSALTNPNLGRFTRRSDRPDLFQAELTSYNFTLEYDFDFADFTSSSTYSTFDQLFVVDLAGTFGQFIPFALDAYAYDDIFVQEVRLASDPGGDLDWIIGGFLFDKRRDVDFLYRSTQEFLDARMLTGLPDEYYQRFFNHTNIDEAAAFGELTYRFGDNFWLTGGLRYTHNAVQTIQEPGGYNSNYLGVALGGFSNIPLTVTQFPNTETPGLKVTSDKVSWKLSASFKPSEEVTTYATVATGFRPPVANARAGLASALDPTDLIIPNGATSDSLTNYEVGVKGLFFNGALSANLAAYYIDWRDIQVQANRISDAVQFATNIGGAESMGIEFELFARPADGLTIAINGSINDTEVTDLTAAEAAISGAEPGIELASPNFQGSITTRYSFPISNTSDAFVSATVAHVGDYPAMFPNTPGQPTVTNPLFDYTEAYIVVNLLAGAKFGDVNVTAYVENLFDNDAITYVHPEAFIDGRYGRLRPLTFGVRTSFSF